MAVKLFGKVRDAFIPRNRETHIYLDDAEGNPVGYVNRRKDSKTTGIIGLLQSMGGQFKDSEGNPPPPGFMENLTGQGDPSQQYHFQRIGGGKDQPGFYVEGSNLGNIGQQGFMQQVVQNNPDWQFGQTWGRNRYGIGTIPLPDTLQYQPTFTQNQRMINGRPHVWDGTQWVPAAGY